MIATIAAAILAAAPPVYIPPPPPVPPPPPMPRRVLPPAPPPPPVPAPPPWGPQRVRSIGSLGNLFSTDDYPASALRNREEGVVGFRLAVGPNGRITSCAIAQSSGSAALDAATCRLLTFRARFHPARDPLGNAVADSLSGRIVWRIMNSLDRDWTPARFVEGMRATAAGAVSCRRQWDSDPSVEESCRPEEAVRIAAAARASGRPLERTIVSKLTPEGMAEPPDLPGRGEAILAADAVFKIGPDGVILGCQLLRNEYLGSERKRGVPKDPCKEWDRGGNLYRPAPDGASVRIVNLKVRGYLKR